MEDQCFDRWTRQLSPALSRRQFAGLLAAFGLGTARKRSPEAAAKRKKRGHKHKHKRKRKRGKTCQAGAVKCGQQCVHTSNDAQHCGDCETACGQGETCEGGACTSGPAGCGAGGECLVFATSLQYSGNLGGLTGADQKCHDLAAAASLPGVYKAWLSDSTGTPAARFVQSTGPYVLVGGAKIADSWADLTNAAEEPNHHLDHEINRDEIGREISEDALWRFTWTNTKPDGTPNTETDHCQNWSTNAGTPNFGSAGNVNATDSFWTFATSIYCSNNGLRLYCFQQS